MTKKLYKYKRSFAYLFLISYTFLVSLTILHYHHVDIQGNDYIISQESNSNFSSPFDKLIDLTHSCPILQFASTVLNYNKVTHFSSTRNIGEKNFIQFESQNLFHSLIHRSNPLRAPPSQS